MLNRLRSLLNRNRKAVWTEAKDAQAPDGRESIYFADMDGCRYIVQQDGMEPGKEWSWVKMSAAETPLDMRIGFATAEEARKHAQGDAGYGDTDG